MDVFGMANQSEIAFIANEELREAANIVAELLSCCSTKEKAVQRLQKELQEYKEAEKIRATAHRKQLAKANSLRVKAEKENQKLKRMLKKVANVKEKGTASVPEQRVTKFYKSFKNGGQDFEEVKTQSQSQLVGKARVAKNTNKKAPKASGQKNLENSVVDTSYVINFAELETIAKG